MNITFRPASDKEAWEFIQGRHRSYHSHLKHFGYGYKMFIPNHPEIHDMYEHEKLTQDQISRYRDIFLTQIYNKERLQRFDATLEKHAIPALNNVIDVLSPMAKKWGITFPNSVEIITTYGGGGSYQYENNVKIIFRMTNYQEERTVGLLQHEFIHLLIELPIIQKYKVPQDLKERIVDIIGFEYFGRPVQKMFENSFANNYISRESIESDLPNAVQKMMKDYNMVKIKNAMGKTQE